MARYLQAFGWPGFWGVQVARRWQIDLSDHRVIGPSFAVRYRYARCGLHIGPWCLRAARLGRR